MLRPELIDEIHRLHWHQKWSLRDIARHLNLNRRTVTKYLIAPSAVVILQPLRRLGYQGGISILKQSPHGKRAARSTPRAFVRVESLPGDRFEIDGGHFGSLQYEVDARKLYAFSLVECLSRMSTSSLLTASVSKPSSDALSTLSRAWVESLASWSMTVWQRPSPTWPPC